MTLSNDPSQNMRAHFPWLEPSRVPEPSRWLVCGFSWLAPEAEPVKPWLEPFSKSFLLYEYVLNFKDIRVCSCYFGKNRLNSEDSDYDIYAHGFLSHFDASQKFLPN
ncbi:hypothetical protein PsorP6_011632 [Peronosclerospora sorghi]|uniref:Uncharacterized protein n=1 Tax=Peronosclerospora sorghi TaxID=230839 RepID=A0ACC0WJR4_9STRA|nr:hypothetical protein PsorP6_011632 [Peronosclerospora sorghi]